MLLFFICECTMIRGNGKRKDTVAGNIYHLITIFTQTMVLNTLKAVVHKISEFAEQPFPFSKQP